MVSGILVLRVLAKDVQTFFKFAAGATALLLRFIKGQQPQINVSIKLAVQQCALGYNLLNLLYVPKSS
jgi:hypothetical protein